jgi:hypothetical protein
LAIGLLLGLLKRIACAEDSDYDAIVALLYSLGRSAALGCEPHEAARQFDADAEC